MKTKFLTSLLFVAFLGLNAQSDYQLLKKDDFAISYPTDWESSSQLSQPGMQFLLLSDESTQNNDKFRENINLTTENLGGQNLTMDEYAQLSIDQILTQIPNSKLESKTTSKLDGQESREIIWSGIIDNGIVLKFKQLFTLYNGKAYILTFSSSTAEYDQFVTVADTVFDSFKFAK